MTPNEPFSRAQQAPVDDAPLIDLDTLFKALRRQWWVILLATLFFGGLAALYLARATPIYQATATLEVRQGQRTIIDISQLEDVTADREFLSTQVELLRSRSLVETVILELNLLRDPYIIDPEDEDLSKMNEEDKLAAATTAFLESFSVSPVGRSRLIRISFRHPDRQRASEIVNTLAQRFVGRQVDTRIDSASFAREFLETRLKDAQASLNTAERELVEYANQNDLILVERESGEEATGTLDADIVVQLNQELANAQSDLVSAKLLFEQSQRNTYGTELAGNTGLARLRELRAELNSQYIERSATLKPEFPEMVELKNQIDFFDRQIADEEGRIIQGQQDRARNAYEDAQARVDSFRSRLNTRKAAINTVRERSITYGILRRQVETERAQYESLLQRFGELDLTDEIGESLVQVVDLSQIPLLPVSPNLPRTMALALLLGLLSGGALAFFIQTRDTRLRGMEDIQRALGENMIGAVPIVSGVDYEEDPEGFMVALGNPQSELSEAYATLRTNLRYSGPDGGPRVLQVTSTVAGEGKSTTSLGLASRIAGVGHKVLLIDADMRRPTFSGGNEDATGGLANLLSSRDPLSHAVRATRFDGLDMIATGPRVVNPSETLSTERFDEIIAEAQRTYAYVIVDSPPVLGLADAIVIANKVSATIMVVESGRLKSEEVLRSIQRLRDGGANIAGVLLSKLKATAGKYDSYYQYRYGANDVIDGPSKRKNALKHKTRIDLTL